MTDPTHAASPPAVAAPALRSEAARAQRLVVTRRRAGALLAFAVVLFLVTTFAGGDSTAVGYLQAFAEAAVIGGLADWFAVTALFRHPLGIPIPHTAIVVARQEQFAETLGDFVQESLLTPAVITERVRAARIVPRLADWLIDPANAARVAGEVAGAGVQLADLLRDDDVHRAIEGVVRDRLDAVEVAPLAGRALQFLTEGHRHDEALDAAFRGLDRYLDEHRDELRERLGRESPWWLPGAVEDQIFERLIAGARAVLGEMAGDQEHQLRQQLELRIQTLIGDLQHSPELLARGEELKRELLDQPELRDLAATVWRDAKDQLRTQAANPDSELRDRLAAAMQSLGRRLNDDPVLAARAEAAVERATAYVADRFEDEIGGIVTSTISKWDSRETARRLELLLGPDLQYIRINGTVVGGIAGLALHAITQAR